MKPYTKYILPIVILFISVSAYGLMLAFKEKPQSKPIERKIIPVEAIAVKKTNVVLSVASQGTVIPRTVTGLTAQVGGRIKHTAESFHKGGFFKKGDIIINIERGDYEDLVVQAESNLAQARLKLMQEQAVARQAEKDWASLGKGQPNKLALRKPQLMEAEAALRSARADLRSAKRNLKRTQIRAPYHGMIQETHIGIGQYVAPGTSVAKMIAIDYAEVRLPVSEKDLLFLNLPEYAELKNTPLKDYPLVKLSAQVGNEKREWTAQITHTEGIFDPKSRVMYLVARIIDPYNFYHNTNRQTCHVGLFVKAEIQGKEVNLAVTLPRNLVSSSETVLVIDHNNRLYRRRVQVLKYTDRNAIIQAGIDHGELVCATPLDVVVDGMKVEPLHHGDKK